MVSTSDSTVIVRSAAGNFAGWLLGIGVLLLLGSSGLAARLIWEQTVWSWERGPQMVGFMLVHGGGALLVFSPALLVGWLAIAIVYLLLRCRRRRPLWWACLIVAGLSAAPFGLMSLSYGFWQRLFVDKLSHGPYAGEFLVQAAAVGDLATVETFVAHRLSVNSRDREGRTALHGAAVQGQTDVIRYLVSVGADVNAIDRMGNSPLQIATSQDREESARLLADHGAVSIHGSQQQREKVIDEQVKKAVEQLQFLHTNRSSTPANRRTDDR
jgi:hypothetical protein